MEPATAAPPLADRSGRIVDPALGVDDPVKSILDRKLLLLELPDRRWIGMRPVHDLFDLFIQIPVVALQSLSFQ